MCRHGRTFCMEQSNRRRRRLRILVRLRGLEPGLLHFQVETLECDGAHLTLETSKPGKLPLEFAIAHLKLTGHREWRGDGL